MCGTRRRGEGRMEQSKRQRLRNIVFLAVSFLKYWLIFIPLSASSTSVASKRKKELVGPEAKRSRSQSPCVAADFRLPPFNPSNPLGETFTHPQMDMHVFHHNFRSERHILVSLSLQVKSL